MNPGQLRNRIDVYGNIQIKNELGELEYSYVKIKSIWSEIKPSGGSLKSTEAGTVYADISHKIIIRANSITNLTNDMYFIYKGQRYNVKYFNPNYKCRDAIEIMCSLVVE